MVKAFDSEESLMTVNIVFDKIATLIKYNMWGNVTYERFKRWTQQFNTDEERYYAAYLAKQLIYYNNKDFISLINYSFAMVIKKILQSTLKTNEYAEDLIWAKKMEEVRRNTLVCPLTFDAAASGSMTVRILRNLSIISEEEICNSETELINKLQRRDVHGVIFVDDMIGSGTQVLESLIHRKEIGNSYCSLQDKILELRPSAQIFVCVAVAPEESLRLIESDTNLQVSVAEVLDTKQEVLNDGFWDPGHYENAMKFLSNLNAKENIPLSGFSDKSWALTFEHGAPDLSSPFYYKEQAGWTSLIPYRGEEF
ncbi:hypothetical protein M2277_001892 [Paenibacillus sp. LBL]|uniref:phosphoribosyltransferase-like protein n=1 Tax=Paenibacillus TaxID=44249 RepID=UPI00096FA032|nr:MULTISPECIES: hypothetical protein [Paenibacillus]MDH6671242.1 hypothetical protein [Paenibacillus sp. LBL]OMF72038.1 hypothetical protein BK142_21370 [Paenibacillus glucanolyticus]